MAKPLKVLLKILIWIVSIAVAALLLVDVAANIALRGPNATKLAEKYGGPFVKGGLTVGGGDFRYLLTYPNAVINIKDVDLCEESDTLVHIGNLHVEANYLSALKKYINLPMVRLDGLEVNTLDFLDLPPAKDSTEKKPLPHLDGVLEIPDARLTVPGIVEDVAVDIAGTAAMDSTFNAALSKLNINVDGLEMSSTAAADDILGDDPLFQINAAMKTVLDKVIDYIPVKGMTAQGDLTIGVEAEAYLSQLNISHINEADITADLTSDGFRVSLNDDRLFASSVKPRIKVRTVKGAPMTATVNAGNIEVKDSDSLVLSIDDSNNKITLNQIVSGGNSIPQVSLNMLGSRLQLKMGEDRAAATNFTIDATGGVRHSHSSGRGGRGRRGDRPRPERRPEGRPERFSPDSLRHEPEWLSEKEFEASDVNFHIDRSLVELLRKWTPFGKITFETGVMITPRLPLRNSVSAFVAEMNEDDLKFENFTVTSGASDLTLSGSARNVYKVMTSDEHGAVQLDLKANSNRFNLDEFLAALKEGAKAKPEPDSLAEKSKIIVLPANLAGHLDLGVQLFHFLGYDFRRTSLKANMRERCLQILDMNTSVRDLGTGHLDGFYSSASKQNLTAAANVELKNVPAQNLLEKFPSLSNSVPLLETFTGDLACNVAATGKFDSDMAIQVPSITGSFHIEGKDLVVEDLGSYKKYARMLFFKDKQRGVINDLNISGIVSDNVVEVFPFLLTLDRYAFAFSGRQSFTDGFTYKVSLIESLLPIRVGVKLFGDDFNSRLRFRLMKPQFKNRNIPVYYEEEQQMRQKLLTDIRNVFSRNINNVLREQRALQFNVEQMRSNEPAFSDNEEEEELSEEELAEIDELELEMEIERQNAELNDEIDKMLEDLWKI